MILAGINQLCAGLRGGCEAAVHVVRHTFDSLDCQVIILIDASNAFNSLNRKLALPNTSTLPLNCHHLNKLLSL